MKTVAFLLSLLASAGCYAESGVVDHVKHKYLMKGQVVGVSAEGVYLCIGTSDGAKVGDEFKVYKVDSSVVSEKAQYPKFKRVEVGTVKINQIVDEHFAKAAILKGQAEANYIVELEAK